MTKGTFIGMTRAAPEKFQFSIKVPETVTHVKRLDIKKGAMLLAISRILNNFSIDYPPLTAMITLLNSDILLGVLKGPGKC
jgi:uncharacterized protein YecE (DUF72 family)